MRPRGGLRAWPRPFAVLGAAVALHLVAVLALHHGAGAPARPARPGTALPGTAAALTWLLQPPAAAAPPAVRALPPTALDALPDRPAVPGRAQPGVGAPPARGIAPVDSAAVAAMLAATPPEAGEPEANHPSPLASEAVEPPDAVATLPVLARGWGWLSTERRLAQRNRAAVPHVPQVSHPLPADASLPVALPAVVPAQDCQRHLDPLSDRENCGALNEADISFR